MLVNYTRHSWRSERPIFRTTICHPLCPTDLFLHTSWASSYSIVSKELSENKSEQLHQFLSSPLQLPSVISSDKVVSSSPCVMDSFTGQWCSVSIPRNPRQMRAFGRVERVTIVCLTVYFVFILNAREIICGESAQAVLETDIKE